MKIVSVREVVILKFKIESENTNTVLSCTNASPIKIFGDKPVGRPFDDFNH